MGAKANKSSISCYEIIVHARNGHNMEWTMRWRIERKYHGVLKGPNDVHLIILEDE